MFSWFKISMYTPLYTNIPLCIVGSPIVSVGKVTIQCFQNYILSFQSNIRRPCPTIVDAYYWNYILISIRENPKNNLLMECFSCVTFRSITLTIYLVRFLFSSIKNFVFICFGLFFFLTVLLLNHSLIS